MLSRIRSTRRTVNRSLWMVQSVEASLVRPWGCSPRLHKKRRLLAPPAPLPSSHLQTPGLLLPVVLLPLLMSHSPAPGLFLPMLPPLPSGREAARSLPRTRFGTRGSTLPSGTEEAPPPLLTHFGPRGSTSLGGPSASSRGPPRTLGHEVGYRSLDSGVGVQYPAGGCCTRRRSHGSDRLPLSIPSVGGSQGGRLGAGQEHRRTGSTTGTRRLSSSHGSSPFPQKYRGNQS